MTSDRDTLTLRLERLERSSRHTRVIAAAAATGLLVTWSIAATVSPDVQRQDVVRTGQVVVMDAEGRDRIVLGAPMPDGREYVGMKILNADGAEQFGLGLRSDGSVSMGFDTKPGVGDPRNRERLNMGVTATGRGWIRYLDNDTRARLWLRLDSDDAPVLQFLDWPDGEPIRVRQLDFTGERRVEWNR